MNQKPIDQPSHDAKQPLPKPGKDDPPDDLTPEEARQLADTMPGDGPGDD